MNESLLKLALAVNADNVHIPEFDIAAIRARAAAQRAPRRRSWILPALLVLVPSFAVAAVVLLQPVRVQYLPTGNLRIYAHKIRGYARITDAQAAQISKEAHYRVILPAGLPAGAKMTAAMIADNNAMLINYNLDNSKKRRFIGFAIWSRQNTVVIHGNLRSPFAQFGRLGQKWRYPVYEFIAGEEHVRMTTNALTKRQIRHIRDAMIAKGEQLSTP